METHIHVENRVALESESVFLTPITLEFTKSPEQIDKSSICQGNPILTLESSLIFLRHRIGSVRERLF